METLEDARGAIALRIERIVEEMTQRANTATTTGWLMMQSRKDELIDLLEQLGGNWTEER